MRRDSAGAPVRYRKTSTTLLMQDMKAANWLVRSSATMAGNCKSSYTANSEVAPKTSSFRLGDNSPGTMRMLFPGRSSTVRQVGALSDLDNISVRIADVAARLAVLGNRLRDELGSSTFP